MSSDKKKLNRDDLVAVGFILAFTLLQLIFIRTTPWELAPDEAHYWEWSRRLDWSYYSKGPVVALLIWASRSLLGETEFAVRLPAVLSSAVFSTLFYLGARWLTTSAIALTMLIALRATMFFGTLGLAMTTDAPCFMLWMAGLLSILFAYGQKPGSLPQKVGLILFGVCFGCATLAKYTAAFVVPIVSLLILSSAIYRERIRFSGLVLANGCFALMLFPIVYWNSQHNWVNLRHNSAHVVANDQKFAWGKYVGELIGGQALAVGPILLVLLLVVLWKNFRGFVRARDDFRRDVLLWTALPLILLCCFVSLTKRVYLNWPLPAFVSAFLLFGYSLAHGNLSSRIVRWIRPGILASLVCLAGTLAVLADRIPLPANKLPTHRLVGWKQLGSVVDSQLTSELASSVITDDYGAASEIAFYTARPLEMFCFNEGTRRMNQYDVWGGWAKLTGKDVLIVLKYPAPGPELVKQFESIEVARTPLEITHRNSVLRTFYFFIGRNFSGDGAAQATTF